MFTSIKTVVSRRDQLSEFSFLFCGFFFFVSLFYFFAHVAWSVKLTTLSTFHLVREGSWSENLHDSSRKESLDSSLKLFSLQSSRVAFSQLFAVMTAHAPSRGNFKGHGGMRCVWGKGG